MKRPSFTSLPLLPCSLLLLVGCGAAGETSGDKDGTGGLGNGSGGNQQDTDDGSTGGSGNGAGASDSGGTGGNGTGGESGGTGGNGTGGNGAAAGCDLPTDGTNPNRVCIKGKSYYLNGINVAWDQWTADLTNYNEGTFNAMFADLASIGANAIRWWWFIDGSGQLSYDGQLVQPLSQNIFTNLDRAFDAAAAHGVFIMPVLLSFDIRTPGREWLVTNPDATDSFVTNVVIPLVERYNDHPGMGLWEIMNEGDWLLVEEGGSVSIADYQRFHGKIAAGIHAADPDALVTTGAAFFKYMQASNNILSDAALQAAAGGDPLAKLDVYQTHYYDWMHGSGWSYEPWIQTATEWLPDGKPILVGEFACKGEPGRWSSLQMHTESVHQGYAGTFCWAYFDNRLDDEGYWPDAKPGMEAIVDLIPEAMTGE